jgi:hypothetical protein
MKKVNRCSIPLGAGREQLLRRIVVLALWSALAIPCSYAQLPHLSCPQIAPDHPSQARSTQVQAAPAKSRALGPLATRDWRSTIDSYWGPGIKTKKKLKIFRKFWNEIDQKFACFHDLDIDWQALRAAYESEIKAGVSAGRFAAIMNHLSRRLKDAHTIAADNAVNGTSPAPGVPLLTVGAWGDNGHFGAGLTPLMDGSLLVYQVVPNHPLGLEVGDIVLGYEGVPWKDIYPQLIEAELPLRNYWWGSSPSSYEHAWLMAAGLNWHLFDTIDVVKHDTGQTLHLSTLALGGENMPLFCSEQMPVAGVPFPRDIEQNVVSYGIVEGTGIGYIYVWGWYGNAESEFRAAVAALVNNTTGLIIDFRMNLGGNMFLSNAGLSLLFPHQAETIGFVVRSDPADHLAMKPDPASPESLYVIPSNGVGYDKPIAVLIGPGAVSSGDQVALRMQFHPRARVFGKPTAAAFNSPVDLDVGDANWVIRYAAADSYLVSAPTHYLTHDELRVDEPAWHTQSSVVSGHDAVVDAAINWIRTMRLN